MTRLHRNLLEARKRYQHALITRQGVKDAEKRLQAALNAVLAAEVS